MPKPLEGIRVLDWTEWQMGPAAGAMLADLGAEVIHIERRMQGDGGRGLTTIGGTPALSRGKAAYFEIFNHGKKSIALDLYKEKGQEVVYRLVKKADIFLQNYRGGVAERLKMDYETIRQHNPKIIYAYASGYGPKGPEANEPAYDPMAMARAGIMFQTGEPDMPPQRIERGIADQMGAIMLAYGVIVALLVREKHGIGQRIDVSGLGAMMHLQASAVGLRLYTGVDLPRTARTKAANPLWNYYLCKDGRWLMLSMLQADRYWPTICKALGIPQLEKDSKYVTMPKRQENCEELIAIMDKIFLTRSATEWVKHLKATGDVICTPVQSTSDLLADEMVKVNNYIIDAQHPVLGPVKVAGMAVQFSETPGEVQAGGPELGQNTEEVLVDIGGYSWEEIAQLAAEEVI